MKVDIKRAIAYPFKDPDSTKKIVIGGAFFLIMYIIDFAVGFILGAAAPKSLTAQETKMFVQGIQGVVNIFIGIPLSAIPLGYIIQSSHNEIHDNPGLPEWDSMFYDYFIKGLKYIAINGIYTTCIAILAVIAVISTGLAQNKNLLFVFIPLIIIIFLLYSFISPFITSFYADNFSFKEAFNLKAIFSSISNVFSDYLIVTLVTIALWLIWLPINVILICTCIGAVVPAFLTFIIYLITVNLYAQLYKESK